MMSYIILMIIVILILTIVSTLGYLQKFKTNDLTMFFKILFGHFGLWTLTIGSACIIKYIELFVL